MSTQKEPYILWLPSWYPNKLEPYNGDFIQRHAKAAALTNRIHVLFVSEIEMQENHKTEWNQTQELVEQIIYFKKKKGLLSKVRKQVVWGRLFLTSLKKHFQTFGKPSCVHIHVPWKAGLVGLYLKWRYNLKFVVTEHWGIYNSIVEDNINNRPFYLRIALKKILSQAHAFLSVSAYIIKQVNKFANIRETYIIPNVVDTTLFKLGETKHLKFTFIHVSNMVPLKNVRGIIEAFSILYKERKIRDIQLVMIGNQNDIYKKMAEEQGLLNETIFFRGEISYNEVAKEMRLAHCLILNSNIENSPCVISEALCCGLPVIATNVGGVPEMLQSTNGILIPSNSITALVMAMEKMKAEYPKYELEEISAKASLKYNYDSISQMFNYLYCSLCKKTDRRSLC